MKSIAPLAIAMTIGVLAPVAPASAYYEPFTFGADGLFYYQRGGPRGDIVAIKVRDDYIKMGNPLTPCWDGYIGLGVGSAYYGGGGDDQQGSFVPGRRQFVTPTRLITKIRWRTLGTGNGEDARYGPWYKPVTWDRAENRLKKYWGVRRVSQMFSDCNRIRVP